MLLFDRKFGKEFLSSVPTRPGVYSLFDSERRLLYVGKAKNLRRRLSQYRKAPRTKRGRKMRSLIREAAHIEWQVHDSDWEASLRELRLIQTLAPKRNVAGRFFYRYPLIGLWQGPRHTSFCFTAVPDLFPQFTFYGAFRSRLITGEGFFALVRLLEFVGHPVPRKDLGPVPQYSYVFGFRRLPADWFSLWRDFFKGVSPGALEQLVLKLLDNAGARAKASVVQQDVESISHLWEKEVVPLSRVIAVTGYGEYPVLQSERDPLFLRAGYETSEVEQ